MLKATVLDFTHLASFRNERCGNASDVENRGYFCTFTCCRIAWIWPEVAFRNSPVSRVSSYTSLPNLKTIGKCWAELLMLKHFFSSFLGSGSWIPLCVSSKGRKPNFSKVAEGTEHYRTVKCNFRFQIVYSVAIQEWLKMECGRKSRPIFALFDPLYNYGKVRKMFSARIELTIRPNLWYAFAGRQLRILAG